MLGKRFSGNVDGVYGSATRIVMEEACNELQVQMPLTIQSNWIQFLDAVAHLSFRA